MGGRSAGGVLVAMLVVAAPGCAFRVRAYSDTHGAGDMASEPSRGDDMAGAPSSGDMATPPSSDLASPDLAPPPPPGMLMGMHDTIPADVDLSGEGKIDWAHFGYMNAGDVTRKSGGPSAIAIATASTLQQWGTYTPTYHWTSGTPVFNGSSQAGVYVSGMNAAITVSAPADTTMRTLRVYATQYQSTGVMTAHLSDGSAADYMSGSLQTGASNVYHRFTFQYKAASAGQRLIVTWTQTSGTATGNSVDIMAATLY